MGPIGCPETSVRYYHYSLPTSQEERSSNLLRGGSLKLRKLLFFRGFIGVLKQLKQACDIVFHNLTNPAFVSI